MRYRLLSMGGQPGNSTSKECSQEVDLQIFGPKFFFQIPPHMKCFLFEKGMTKRINLILCQKIRNFPEKEIHLYVEPEPHGRYRYFIFLNFRIFS